MLGSYVDAHRQQRRFGSQGSNSLLSIGYLGGMDRLGCGLSGVFAVVIATNKFERARVQVRYRTAFTLTTVVGLWATLDRYLQLTWRADMSGCRRGAFRCIRARLRYSHFGAGQGRPDPHTKSDMLGCFPLPPAHTGRVGSGPVPDTAFHTSSWTMIG